MTWPLQGYAVLEHPFQDRPVLNVSFEQNPFGGVKHICNDFMLFDICLVDNGICDARVFQNMLAYMHQYKQY